MHKLMIDTVLTTLEERPFGLNVTFIEAEEEINSLERGERPASDLGKIILEILVRGDPPNPFEWLV